MIHFASLSLTRSVLAVKYMLPFFYTFSGNFFRKTPSLHTHLTNMKAARRLQCAEAVIAFLIVKEGENA